MKKFKALGLFIILPLFSAIIGFMAAKQLTPYAGKGESAAISAALPYLQDSTLTARALSDDELARYAKKRSTVNFTPTEIYLISQNNKPVALVELAPFFKSGWHLVEFQNIGMRYFKEAQQIWQTLVPKSGQAETVQGELLRAVERLREEAQNNGNGNWDEGFDRFCDFLEQTLAVTPPFTEGVRQEIRADILRLRDHDHPYLEDDLYDRLSDRVVEFHRHLGKIVPHQPDPLQHR